MDFVPKIRALFYMDKRHDGCLLSLSSRDGDDQPFNGTQGEFIEKIQRACLSAYMQGQHDIYEDLLEHNYSLPCPICTKPMTHGSLHGEGDLHEYILMCNECFYG